MTKLMVTYRFTIASAALFAIASVGCGYKPADVSGDLSGDESAEMVADMHHHPSEGPHHGTLVELGNEEFHAEVVHDDTSVTIYVLDSGATQAVPIDAPEVTINLLHDGTPEQFKLPASPVASDPSGRSSRFMLADAELVAHVDDEAAAPKLTLVVDGTPYRGEIKHDHEAHDHEGHDH